MPAKPKSAFPNPAAVLPGEADILANVLADLSDDNAKLVYADWLEDRDDPRGPLLRAFVTAYRAGKKLPKVKATLRPWGNLVGMTLIEEIRDTALAPKTDQILALARPAISYKTTREPEKALPVGTTKFGGQPDLPAGTKWPKFQGEPLSFLGQFNLADLVVSPVARDLPVRGLFSVFALYDEDDGNDDFDKKRWRFLYFPDDAKLVRHEFDDALPGGSRFKSCRLTFGEALTVPADDSPWWEELDLKPDSDEFMAYVDLHMDSCPFDRLLGYPFTIQDDVLREKSVRHLLTIEEDSRTGWAWGDGGSLYFTINESDLKKKRFDRVMLDMQCG